MLKGGILAGAWLEILEYNQKLLCGYEKSKLRFYAYNLSTNTAIAVHEEENRLFLRRDHVFFSTISERETKAVAEMRHTLEGLAEDNVHRTSMEGLLSLYSSSDGCSAGDAEQHHQHCFIEVKFEIVNNIAFTNNFVCVIPIRLDASRGLVALEPYHGSLWENTTDQVPSFVKTRHRDSRYLLDPRVKQLRTVFDNRVEMRLGIAILAPFLHATRESQTHTPLTLLGGQLRDEKQSKQFKTKHKSAKPNFIAKRDAASETPVIFRQNLYSYGELYAYMMSIAQTQLVLTTHEVDYDKALNVLFAVVQLFGPQNHVACPDMVDMFYCMMVYIVIVCCLGTNLYRADLLGEDINSL